MDPSQLMKVGRILQVEKRDLKFTCTPRFTNTVNKQKSDVRCVHLHLSIVHLNQIILRPYWIWISNQVETKFTPIESNRILKGIETTKEGNERNPKKETRANGTAKRKRGREKIGSKQSRRKQREWSSGAESSVKREGRSERRVSFNKMNP
jgi:hypothetical protein